MRCLSSPPENQARRDGSMGRWREAAEFARAGLTPMRMARRRNLRIRAIKNPNGDPLGFRIWWS